MRGAAALSEELQKRNSKCRVAVVPKTIDNDIPLIDRSFGFDTAVTEAKKFIDVASVEARSFPRGVGVVRLMGRDATVRVRRRRGTSTRASCRKNPLGGRCCDM